MRAAVHIMMMISGLVTGFNLQSMWKKEKISHSYASHDGKNQYLSVKNGCMAYFNLNQNKIFYRENNTIVAREDVHPKNFMCDVDVEKWNGLLYRLVSYYDSKRHQYIAVLPFSDRFFRSLSRIVRCFLVPASEDQLLALIVTSNGEVSKVSYDREFANTTYSSIQLPFSVYMAEFYDPYLYLIDSYQQFHIFCPVREKVLLSKDFLPTPVIHFSVLSHKRMAFALFDQTVRIFAMNEETRQMVLRHVFNTGQPVKKIHIDQHKCVVLLEDGTLSMYDVESGKLWYEKKTLVDTAYTTRLHASHRSVYIDGHREGLIRIHSGRGGGGNVKELDDLATWMNTKFSKPATNPFLTALMNTPPYNATENTQLNWSWPQP